MARSRKSKKKKQSFLSRRARFMRNSALVLAVLMAGSLIGASYYRKTTGHLVRPEQETHEPAKQPRTYHAPAKSDHSS